MLFKNSEYEATIFPVGYAYEQTGNQYDDNWLNVRIRYQTKNTTKEFTEPCLLTWEVQSLFDTITEAKHDIEIKFIESHISFGFSPSRKQIFLFPDFYFCPESPFPVKYSKSYETLKEIENHISKWIFQYPTR